MSAQSSLFAVKAARVSAPLQPQQHQQQQQQQQQVMKPIQGQPTVEATKSLKSETSARGTTPVQAAAATVAEAPRGATPVNASRRTLVLKSYPELKKECEEATAVKRCAVAGVCDCRAADDVVCAGAG